MRPRSLHARLVFNPSSGIPGDSALQLMQILAEMQALRIQAEVHLFQPGSSDLPGLIQADLRRGVRLFVVAGGDGTIDTVAAALAGSRATLGVIPTGTQNNVALSLGIPGDIPAAVALLRGGRRMRIDMGLAVCGEHTRPFLEVCSVGLLSALYPAADDIQHGNLARVGDLLATLVASPPADLHLRVDGQAVVRTQGHVVLVGNMPYIGPHYRVAPEASSLDGLLDVLVFADLNLLELIGSVVQTAGALPEDPRVHRYRARSIEIDSQPPMPILLDGFPWPAGDAAACPGRLTIQVQPRHLNVIAGRGKERD